jgi:DNA-binding IclR family transcriptional regulator
MRVLEVLAECGGNASLKELSWRVNLVKSSLFRILFSLKELGYVEQAEHTGLYGLTWKMHGLMRKGANQVTLLDLARPHMITLRDEVGETVWLAEWRKGTAVVVGGVDVPHRLRFSIDIGSPVGLHSTALGKAIAAHLPPKVLAAALGSGKLPRITVHTIRTREQLRLELERVRGRGYAMNKGESVEGLIAVAAPIFDARGMALGSITVGAPVFRCSPMKQRAIVAATKRTATAITSDLTNVQFETRDGSWPETAVAG